MAKDSDAPKSYRLSNFQLGPRHVETAADGLVTVQPTAPGAPGTTIARLTSEEAENAEANGLEMEELEDGLLAKATGDRPADGFINPNHPDAEEIAKAVHDNARKAARETTRAHAGATSNLDRPVGGGKTAEDKKG